MTHTPPFTITAAISDVVDAILEQIGQCQGGVAAMQPELLRHNRNRAIQASLSIEGNTLSLEEVEAIADGLRPPAAKPREFIEVQNALALYEQQVSLNPLSEKHLLRAHGILMRGLSDHAGTFRRGGVGIKQGVKIVHVAPPAARVPQLVGDLFSFLKDNKTHWLVRSCVFHYEFEFIHPFTDGNGRMGRFWQTLFLSSHRPIFAALPVETVLKERQADYYRVLGESDRSGESTVFVEFMLTAIRDAFTVALPHFMARATPASRLEQARQQLGRRWFDRKTYLVLFPGLSPLSASRDLARGVSDAHLERQGDRRMTLYRFRVG